MDEGNHPVNLSAAIINQSNGVASFLRIVFVSIHSGGNSLNTYGGPTSIVNQRFHSLIGVNKGSKKPKATMLRSTKLSYTDRRK